MPSGAPKSVVAVAIWADTLLSARGWSRRRLPVYPHPQIWRPLALVAALVAATLFATSTITVAPGDTLSEIADRHDVTVAELIEWNDLDDPNRIFAGTTLIVSAPEAASTGPCRPRPAAMW